MSAYSDYLGFHAASQPARTAAIEASERRSWTFAELDRAVSQVAAVAEQSGVGVGDRVACLSRNSIWLIMLHLACIRTGSIFVPINWRLSAPEISALIEDVEPALIVGDEQLERAGQNGMNIADLAARSQRADPAIARSPDPDRPCLILYTSGTSGKPKGAVLTANNLVETAINLSLLAHVTSASRFLCDAPMFHVIGLVANIWPAMMRGGCFVVSDGFESARTLDRLADPEFAITHYFCVPQMASQLRAAPDFDASALRGLTALFTGGAPHPAASICRWLDDGIVAADGFGMSEAGTVLGMPVNAQIVRDKAGSVGIATPRVQTRIVDSDGIVLGHGESGELQIRGNNLFGAYWRKPRETAAAFTDDGWFRTGDIAKADEAGFHWIVDRQKDMFISGGENVYPAEIEAVLAGADAIAECAVVGVPDARWGEVGHLFLVAKPGQSLKTDAILDDIGTRLARYKIPKHVSVIDSLPRSGAGKVLKDVLRASVRDNGNAE